MKNYTITEEQIKELAKGNKKVEKMFPEVFEQKIEKGWNIFYWDDAPHEERELIFVTDIDGDKVYFDYGINLIEKEWLDHRDWYRNEHIYKKATEEEVKSALIKEAERRGFKKGCKFKSSISENNKLRTAEEFSGDLFNFYLNDNELTISTSENEWGECQSNPHIFKDGTWCEIIKTKYLTKKQAEEELTKIQNDGYEYKIID